MSAQERNDREEGTAVQLRFEKLLTDISARFLSMVPQDVDAEIDGAHGNIREFFDANICSLFRINLQTGEGHLSHLQVTGIISVMPEKFNYAPGNPWRFAKLVRGEIILH
jgi:hypothetical protein